MKLLILTQKVNKTDPVLGFFHRWIEEFSKHCEKVIVICLEKGEYSLPTNVEVYSLGKEEGKLHLTYLYRFYKYIFLFRKEYNSVFVHMNPEYVVLGGFIWKMLRKKITLWYVHRQSNIKLWIASILSDLIFTVAKESFSFKSSKVEFVGHGIDVESYIHHTKIRNSETLHLLQVGRITPIKHCEVAIKAGPLLDMGPKEWTLRFVGAPVSREDEYYLEYLKNLTKELGVVKRVQFKGSLPPDHMIDEYFDADVVLNLSPTGGIDKVVLESMAAGVLVISSNQAFKTYFGEYASDLLVKELDSADLAKKIIQLESSTKKEDIRKFLLEKVRETSSLKRLVGHITMRLQQIH